MEYKTQQYIAVISKIKGQGRYKNSLPYPGDIFDEFSGLQYIHTGKYAKHIEIRCTPEELRRIRMICKKYRLNCSYYDAKYGRSNNYRKQFFEEYGDGPYRCRYCNKKLTKEDVTVDHLIPVKKAKTSIFAQSIMKHKKWNSINDVENLVPACEFCNKWKGSKTGLWVIRGLLGKYKVYWAIVYVICALMIFKAGSMWYAVYIG